MANTPTSLAGVARDGTSQVARALEALAPSYVAVDERTTADFLAFARAYGPLLTYYGADGNPAGDFSGFVGAGLDLAQVTAFLNDPGSFDPTVSPALYRPHFVLFLIFLQLHDLVRGELNQLTSRHLDFYYRQILRLGLRPSVPDKVNLIFDLANGVSAAGRAARRLRNPRPDSRGGGGGYQTDADLVANRAQIGAMSSLLVSRRRTTLRQVTSRYPNDSEQCCLTMFSMAVALGNPLPTYPDGAAVSFAKLLSLRASLLQAQSSYYLTLEQLRDLMTRVGLRPAAPAEWDGINAKLEIAGNTKRGGTGFTLAHTSQDFANNLIAAVGNYSLSTLNGINTIDDLYDQRGRADVAAFIQSTLYFNNLDDFVTMIQLKRKFYSDWAGINDILQTAGQTKRNDPTYTLTPTAVDNFTANVSAAIGADATALQTYWNSILALEGYFYMTAEQFAFAMDEVVNVAEVSWSQVFLILEAAHTQKVRTDRRNALKAMRQASPPARLVDLIRAVLGEAPDPSDDPTELDRLVPYLGQDEVDNLTALATANNWDRIYNILEVAESNRVGDPPALWVEWLNMYPAADATKVQPADASTGAPTGDDSQSLFVPFGAAPQSENQSVIPSAVVGWALSSPLLVLREGARIITLTLGFNAPAQQLADIFQQSGALTVRCELSTAAGFVQCVPAPPVFGNYADLCTSTAPGTPVGVKFVLTLDPTLPPIVKLPAGTLTLDSPWPVLRLMLQPTWSATQQQFVAFYPNLAALQLVAAHIEVDVSGLKALQLENDETSLDPKKPFLPFGGQATVGSRFRVGHPEVAGKTLDSLRFDFQWLGAPASPLSYYANYGLATSAVFAVGVSLIEGARESSVAQSAALFSSATGSTGSTPVSITLAKTALASALPASPDILALDVSALPDALANWSRYAIWELNDPDFQYSAYPQVAAAKALALAVATATSPSTIQTSQYQVNPPYTPKLKNLALGYSSSLELLFTDPHRDASVHRVWHIHPFGVCDIEAERTAAGLPFLPQYNNDGELYIGLQRLLPPQTVSIFFQVGEGTADTDLPPPTIKWSYLDGDRWQPLDSLVMSDTTGNLCNSGIVTLSLPAVAASTRLPGGLYWLRAALAQDTPSVCDVVGVHTQAMSATFVDHHNAADHFSSPLPKQSITQLATARPEFADVRQPYTSYGGRSAEDPSGFATRVSEQLRHKGRALTLWDYERLTLDRFPDVHKVKCIPAESTSLGAVTVIVVPDVRNKVPFEPFAPKARADLLADIRDYLAARAPTFASIAVTNAFNVAVRVRLGVRFHDTGDSAFYQKQLNDDLNRFLAPWAYDDGADIAIGGRIYASSIVNFVAARPYVDYVAGIKLFSSEDGVNYVLAPQPATIGDEGYYVETPRPDAVLVPDRNHIFDLLADTPYGEDLEIGIGFMKLELDFTVTVDAPTG